MYRFTPDFKNALIKNPKERCKNDIDIIFSHLKQLEGFKWINDTALRKISRAARYEAYPMNHILFRKGQPATCWYILLTGSVYIDEQIQLPLGCFGKRNEVHLRRISDCIILQPSELIVIDYPDDQRVPIYQTIQETTNNIYTLNNSFQTNLKIKGTQFNDQLDTPYFDCSQVQSSTLRPKQKPLYEVTGEKGSNYNSIDNVDCSIVPQPTIGISRITVQPSSQTIRSVVHNNQISTIYKNISDVSNPLPISGGAPNLPLKKDATFKEPPILPYHQILKNQPPPYVRYRTHNNQLQRKSLDETAMSKSSDKSTIGSSIKQPTLITVGGSSSSSRNDELSGLPEAFVDSDDEEGSCPSHDSFQELRDNVRECLEKEPSMRTLDDILILLDFMSQMQAFASLPISIRRQICLKMLFAVVQDAGTVILQNGDKLDSWSVVVNGYVEWTKPNGEKVEYRMGDSFGATASSAVQYHEGEMRTMTNNCEFLLVEHKDFYHIMSTISQHIEKVSDVTGEVVSETERRVTGNQVGLVIIKAKPEKLLQLLVEESDTISDEHYTEDYLLMYRVFVSDATEIFLRLKKWFKEPMFKEKIPRIVLLWVNSHFNDFESNSKMIKLLEEFGNTLEQENLHSQLALLNIACSVKSKTRTVTITRSNRDQELFFSLIGGKEMNHKLFVADISNNCDPETIGLRRGDEILEVNGHGFSSITLSKALVLLKDSTHLSIKVKWNLMGFKEMLFDMESKKNSYDYESISCGDNPYSSIRYGKNDSSGAYLPPRHHNSSSSSVNTKSSNVSSKNSMMSRLINIIKGSSNGSDSGFSNDLSNTSTIMNTSAINNSSLPPLSGTIRASRSNPDIHINIHKPISTYKYSLALDPFDNVKSSNVNQNEEVIKVYRSDQTFKYLIIYPETTVGEIVKLALQEFGMNTETGHLEWSLCMTSVTPEGAIKQRTLPQIMTNMAKYLNLNSRYYLKNNDRSEPLLPDDVAPDVLKESQTFLVDLNAHTIAVHLTLQDFAIFSKIEATEYVDCLFEIKSAYGWPMLKKFEDIFNVEMWWVATEICSEKIVYKRAKLIKKFIKVARHCRELRNFNSMFAILSGLEKPAVRRLQNSWERIPNKYIKMFNDMQTLLDPSRNMSKYRQHLLNVSQDPPVIPIYPVFKKDLIYSNEANETYCEKLINFEKLRIIGKIIRGVTKLSLVPYTQEVIQYRDSLNMDSKGNTSTIKKLSGVKNGSQSRKKMYEQDLMIKKVKAYLEVMKICDNENELDKMSSECEPPQNSSSGNASSGTSRKRAPSPSSSSVSSQSNQSEQFARFHTPKFGVESPQAVQKMLSLVQNSKIKPANNVKGYSPMQSPMLNNNRSTPKRSNAGIGRIPSFSSRSSSNSTDLHPVDLTAESSSVTTFYTNANTTQNANSTEIGPGAFVRPVRRK